MPYLCFEKLPLVLLSLPPSCRVSDTKGSVCRQSGLTYFPQRASRIGGGWYNWCRDQSSPRQHWPISLRRHSFPSKPESQQRACGLCQQKCGFAKLCASICWSTRWEENPAEPRGKGVRISWGCYVFAHAVGSRSVCLWKPSAVLIPAQGDGRPLPVPACLCVKGDRVRSVCISNVPCQAAGSCVPPSVEAHTVVPIGPQETQPPWDTPGPDTESVKATEEILAGFSVGLCQSHQVHSVVEVSWKHPNKYAMPFCFSSDSKQEQQLLHFLNCWVFFPFRLRLARCKQRREMEKVALRPHSCYEINQTGEVSVFDGQAPVRSSLTSMWLVRLTPWAERPCPEHHPAAVAGVC